MTAEFAGIERRLDELSERLARLQPLTDRTRSDFDADPYLRDIVERNLEIAAQCCIDISHRIISLEGAQKPVDYIWTNLNERWIRDGFSLETGPRERRTTLCVEGAPVQVVPHATGPA